jgi:hypothetical protein
MKACQLTRTKFQKKKKKSSPSPFCLCVGEGIHGLLKKFKGGNTFVAFYMGPDVILPSHTYPTFIPYPFRALLPHSTPFYRLLTHSTLLCVPLA